MVTGIMVSLREAEEVKNFFISTQDLSGAIYDGDTVMDIITKNILGLKVDFSSIVRCVTCDSDAAHVKARKLLQEEMPDVIFLACSAHQVNLIIKVTFKVSRAVLVSRLADVKTLLQDTVENNFQFLGQCEKRKIHRHGCQSISTARICTERET